MKTQLDLFRSAVAVAEVTLDRYEIDGNGAETRVKCVEPKTPFEVQSTALDRFRAEGNSPLDWDMWNQFFTDARHRMQLLSGQKAPSEVAAAAEAKKKAATPAPPTPPAPTPPAT